MKLPIAFPAALLVLAAGALPARADEPARTTIVIQPHRYSLAECLALADRNFPNVWAARARLENTHAILEETKFAPWFQWNAQSSFGVSPPLLGTVIYPQSTNFSRNLNDVSNLQPFFAFNINGVVPLYTFGKIETSRTAAEANVRVSEWDMEKTRMQTRLDLRRAFYGLQFARDASYVAKEAADRLDQAIQSVRDKLAKGGKDVNDVDRLKLEYFRQDLASQMLQVPKAESYALAALRFLTGVEQDFDIVDEPLKRPDRPVAAVAQYLEAARVLRADVNMARAGIVARKALVDYNRARLFPDFGLGLGADYASTPGAVPQNNVWANDPFNHFYYYFALGARWSLDLLPQNARVHQAEAQLDETRSLERAALGNAEMEVERAYADVIEAKSREEVWERAEHITKEWISTVQDHIDLGTWNEAWLLEPVRFYGLSRVNHLQALMDFNVALSNLALVSGWDSAAPGS